MKIHNEMILNKLSIIFIFLLSFSFSFSQEICDNGIDDDGNGLIDLQDSACLCDLFNFNSVSSLIPNHSFEDTLCCPNSHSQMNCATSWQQASTSTTDYYNLCGFTNYWGNPLPPIPIADGNGYCGIVIIERTTGFAAEYVGTCLSDTMFAGTKYKLKVQIAFGTGVDSSAIELFGTNDCNDIPFPTTATIACPLIGTGNWISLGIKRKVLDTNIWNEFEITFTPSQDITAIVIGPACNYFPGYNYIYLDEILLNKYSSFEPKIEELKVNCFEEITL